MKIRESQLDAPGRGMRLIPTPILQLLHRRPVIGESVRLDDEAELGPVEVDAVAVDALLCERGREAGRPGNPDEAALELRVSEGERGAVEKCAQRPDSGLAGASVELGA